MRVLLDECVPARYRHSFPNHNVHSAAYAGLEGRKNGELLPLAEAEGYDVLLTVDQGILHQHNMSGRRISFVILQAPSNDIDTLRRMAAVADEALANLAAGVVVVVRDPAMDEST